MKASCFQGLYIEHGIVFRSDTVDHSSIFRCRHRFLAEFLEVGGALTVLEVVGMRGVGGEEGKSEGLRLLSVIASRGRQFKELLCEGYGENGTYDSNGGI